MGKLPDDRRPPHRQKLPGATRGADIALISDLPPAAGMGSSDLDDRCFPGPLRGQQSDRPRRLLAPHRQQSRFGRLPGLIENGQGFGSLEGDRGVGTFGGSENHTAILCAESNCISQYAYAPIEFRKDHSPAARLCLPGRHSGAAAENTARLEKYNSVARLATALLDLWRRRTGRDDASLAAALDSSPDAAERLAAMLPNAAGGHRRPLSSRK